MMKRIALFLAVVMMIAVLTGCTGTPVIYMTNCTCESCDGTAVAAPATESAETVEEPAQETVEEPAEEPAQEIVEESAEEPSETAEEEPAEEEALHVSGSPLMTGLYIGTGLSDSKNASAEENGEVKYDVTVVAVTVDDMEVINSCIIDSLPASVAFDAAGNITSDLAAVLQTKGEMGEAYGMKAYGGAKYEWNEQVAALAEYAVGKTVDEFRNVAIDEAGMAKDADLATTATIYLGGYVDAVVKAAENAKHVGALSGDELRMAIIPSLSDSTSATAEGNGNAQLNVDVAALTMSGDIITSCYIDSLQAKVAFDASGVITTDLTAPVQTKNELGEAYGMKAYAGSAYEWNEQAAAFCEYVSGKTAEQVSGIAVNEKTAPADADLAATVTIAIGGFQDLIEKAAQ